MPLGEENFEQESLEERNNGKAPRTAFVIQGVIYPIHLLQLILMPWPL